MSLTPLFLSSFSPDTPQYKLHEDFSSSISSMLNTVLWVMQALNKYLLNEWMCEWQSSTCIDFRYFLFLKWRLWVRNGTNIHFYIVSFKVSHMLHHTKCSLNSSEFNKHFLSATMCYSDQDTEMLSTSSSSSTPTSPTTHTGGGTAYYSFIKQTFVERLLCVTNISSFILLLCACF